MESALVDQTVDPLLRTNPATDVANHVRAESVLETAKRMISSNNAKLATNANFYPLGNTHINFINNSIILTIYLKNHSYTKMIIKN